MDIGMLHLHTTSIILFLLFFIFKTILLFTNKIQLLEKVRAKTKWIDIVLGVLILSTGIYLLTRQEVIATYLLIKVVLVLAAIPLGIIALKKNKKPLAVLALFLFVYVYGISETKSPVMKKPNYSNLEGERQDIAKKIYEGECARCHGLKGNSNLYGSKDLPKSTLSTEDKFQVIKNGKNAMPAFGTKFTDEQLRDITAYVEAFKN